ncbi:MAG: thiamine phosphate synthase [Spirochaetales bacterium]|nr:thiamine phosphate synthase [Spirochaetales bacterium]
MCMSDIICVTNRKLCREDFLTRIERIAACRPAGIILREKDMLPGEYRKLAAAVIEICNKYDVKCILHGFPTVAISFHVNAVHLPLHILRTMSQEQKAHFSILGTSCHSVEDSVEAQALGCTYIIAGHVFETDCKKGLPGRGPDFLRNVCAAVNIPVYGIGGINTDNITSIRDVGAEGACLMSSLMETEDVTELMKAMEGKNET